MLTSIREFVQDNYNTVEAASIAVGTVLIALWLWSRYRARRLAKPVGPLGTSLEERRARAAQPEDPATIHSSHGALLRAQVARDVIVSRRFRRAFEQRKASVAKVQAANDLRSIAHVALETEQRGVDESIEVARSHPVAIFNRAGILTLNGALIVGDVLIVRSSLLSNDGFLTERLAYVASLAVAVSIWLAGKIMGDAMSEWPERHRKIAKFTLGVVVLLAAALGLALLRVAADNAAFLAANPGFGLAVWLLLALAPGGGSAALTMASSNTQQKQLRIADARWRRKSLVIFFATRRWQRAATRLNRLEAREAVWVSDAQLQSAGIREQYGLEKLDGALLGPEAERKDSYLGSVNARNGLLTPDNPHSAHLAALIDLADRNEDNEGLVQ